MKQTLRETKQKLGCILNGLKIRAGSPADAISAVPGRNPCEHALRRRVIIDVSIVQGLEPRFGVGRRQSPFLHHTESGESVSTSLRSDDDNSSNCRSQRRRLQGTCLTPVAKAYPSR